MTIRPATEGDAAAIATIWNPLIRETVVTFNPVEKSEPEIAAMIAERQTAGYGFWVGLADDIVCGFATYSQFRGGAGYARTMEHTIILAPNARGRGLGRALMNVLEHHARVHGVHSMFAGVSSANPEGLAFHAAIGYGPAIVLPQVGYKFDNWYDLHLMQKFL